MDSQHILGPSGWPFLQSNDFKAWESPSPKPQGSASFAAILSAFVPTWITATLFVSAFIIIRGSYPKIYSPRTYIGTIPEKHRTPTRGQSWLDWYHTFRAVPDKFTLYHQSLDAYLFLRLLRTLIFICVVGAVLTWPILMPINATGGGSSTQLDKITIGNIAEKKKLYAHAVIAWVFFAFVMFTVARERLWLIGLRQAWNISEPNAKRLSSRTVLFLSAPSNALDEQNLQPYFGEDAVRSWPATKAEKLESLVSDRAGKVAELEAAEISLILAANKKARKSKGKNSGRPDNVRSYGDLSDSVKKSLRPSHTLKTTQPIGKKVDSIHWLREQIKDKESEIEKLRESYSANDTNGAAAVFVEFRTITAAQQAYQQITSSGILSLVQRYTAVVPGDIVWSNLTLPPARRISQESVATTLVVLTIIFWFIPVAFVAAISNVSYLANEYKWLSFLKSLPSWIIGLLSGLIPPLATSALSKYIPNIFRLIFLKFGEPTKTSAEIKVLKWYYVFQVIHVFLVTAVASGSAAAIPQIARQTAQDPLGIPAILARNLPTSANYYLTYFIVQALTSASDNLLNYSDLLTYLFLGYFLDKTPRQKYDRYTSLRGLAWGKLFPKYTNFVIIAIAYSCIAPLVLGFAAGGLTLFYISYRYMLLYTVQPKIDTKGHCYTLALQQVLTGVYVAELSLIGLFGLRKATGPSIIIAVLFIVTIIYNAFTNRYFKPLEEYLPANLGLELESDNGEQAPLLSSAEEGTISHHVGSHLQTLSDHVHSVVPTQVSGPITRFFQPHIATTHKAMKAWLQDGDLDENDVPEYKEDDLKKVYLNPALTSKTPVIWLARDNLGVSANEIQENKDSELEASDKGAWVDEKGNLKWSVDDFGEIPIFKEAIRW